MVRLKNQPNELIILRHRSIDTPLGTFVVFQRESGAIHSRWLEFDGDDDDDAELLAESREDKRWQSDLFAQLKRYFSGRDADLTLAPTPPGPDFYVRCWNASRRIKPGNTISYGELAKRAGSSKAVRAAGQAMRHNPLPVIVPCHRVISSSGTLHGFAGETDPECAPLRLKMKLLELELHQRSEPPRFAESPQETSRRLTAESSKALMAQMRAGVRNPGEICEAIVAP